MDTLITNKDSDLLVLILNLSVHQGKDSFKDIVYHHSKIVKELIPDPVQTSNFTLRHSEVQS